MSLRRLAGAVLYALLSTANAAESEPQEGLYLNAMRALADGRQDDASAVLSRMVTLEPQHAGAWLDLAIIQCELGHAEEAERLFEAIVTRFSPPAGILEVIAISRARGCTGWHAGSKLSVLAGRGADSNVNQGASSPSFSFGYGENATEAQLLPEFLPRRDQFTVLQADYSRDLTPNGTSGTVQLQARFNDRLTQYNAAALIVGVEHPWRWHDWGVRGIGSFGLLSLGGKLYQAQTVLQARVTPIISAWPQKLQLTVTPGFAHVKYPTLTNYDANTVELRTQLTWRLPQVEFNASAGYLGDFAASARPGGDRTGWSSGLRGTSRIAGGVLAELGWSRQTWQSQSAYSPGLINTIRHQDLQILRGTLIFPIRRGNTLQLEVRNVHNAENISIFQYNSRQVQLSWQWQDF